jgi:NTP pyrophosphatase (non-canonical NTP hydrolase)
MTAELANDSLRDLAQSTMDFYARFEVVPQVSSCVKNFREEVDELVEAVQTGSSKDHTAEEAADVFVTAIGLCCAAGVEIEQLIAQVYVVIAKNNAKTHLTHVYADGKIRRRTLDS